mgnify:FL=1
MVLRLFGPEPAETDGAYPFFIRAETPDPGRARAAARPMTDAGAPGGRIAIVGAGIVGVSTAIWLQRAGAAVDLIDRQPPGEGASFGNAGVLAASAVAPVTVPGVLSKAPRMLLDPSGPLFLRWRDLPRLAPWLLRYAAHANAADAERCAAALRPLTADTLAEHRALSAGTGAERYVVPGDYLYLYRDRPAFEADQLVWEMRRRAGFFWETLEGAALRAHDPVFAPDQRFAARLGGHGRITDPGAYVKALAAHAEREGARVIRADALGLRREGDAVTGLRLRAADGAEETQECGAVVVAAGAWSSPLCRALGLHPPLETERGYHLELWEPSVTPAAPTMIASAKVVATPMEGRLRLAGVVEFGGLKAGPSAAPRRLLRRQARAIFPGLTWRAEREWMGHRPATADSIPVIGPVPAAPGAWVGFGHHHVGLTAGPATGRLLARMISGARPNIDVSPYDPGRFARPAKRA